MSEQMTTVSSSTAAGLSMSAARDHWLGLEIRHLQALAAIAREGSFRGAADALDYVQSAVSQQLAQLERLVGARLVERSRGNVPVTVTEAGRVLLEHVEEILARYERAHADLESLSEGRIGTLKVGMLQSVATRMLPQMLPRFAQHCPGVQIAPTESAADSGLFTALLDGDLDLAICELPVTVGPFLYEQLLEDPMFLMVSASSPLARREAVTMEDLDGLRLIGYSRSRAMARAHDWLRASGVEPTVVFASDHNATVQSLVASDMGAALAPYLAVDAGHPGTALLPIEDAPARTIALAWHSDRELSPAGMALRGVARAVCGEIRREIRKLSPSD